MRYCAAMRARLAILFLAILPPALLGCQTHSTTTVAQKLPANLPAAPPDSSNPKSNGEVFDQVWEIILKSHVGPTIASDQWSQRHDQYRERAREARSQHALRIVLSELLQSLDASHFAIIPQSATASTAPSGGWSGLTLQVFGDEVLVTHIAEESPAKRAGVHQGWRLLTAADHSMDEVVKSFGTPQTSLERLARDHALVACLSGRLGSSVDALFVDAEGTEHAVAIALSAPPGQLVTMGNLPPFAAESKWHWLSADEIGQLGGDPARTGRVGYLRFSVWLTPLAASIDEALRTFRAADAVVIDLRGNPGGLGLMATGVAGHFLPAPTSLGTMRGRDMKLEFRTNPRTVDPEGNLIGTFSGPLAILMDSHSGSTSEIFAAGLLDIKRAQPFGQTSAGAALPATTHNLKNGDVLLHAIGDFRTPSGGLVEGIGVRQVIGNPPTRADYTSSPDPELRDALRWIASERVPTNATPSPTP